MDSKKAKKPVLYWVALMIMITAFVGVALSADANGLNEQGTGIGAVGLSTEFVANSASDALCVAASPLHDEAKL
jgi:hypothetical protein